MNALIHRFPTETIIDGLHYQINSDFRTCLKAILAFEDSELADFEKHGVMLELLYPAIPQNIQKAIEKAIQFLNGGDGELSSCESETSGRLYSFSKDAKYIYSAIKQTHGIDLESINYLHWWKFIYLFMGIDEKCFFSRMIYYRQKMKKGMLTKEEREYCNSIAEILALGGAEEQFDVDVSDEFFAQLSD